MVGSEINQKINTVGRFKEEKKMISTFLVELHRDDVLEVLLVIGVDFLTYKTCI